MCAVLSPLQICPLSGGKFRFSPSPIPCFNSLPVQALLGLLFSFSAYPPVFLSHLSEWRRNQFSLTWGGWPLPPDSLTTGSHASNGAGNPSRWCRFPTLSPKPHTGPHRAEFWFSHQNELTPPPLGGGARYRLFGLLVFSRREARCFSAGKDGYFVSEGFSWQLPWQLLLTTGSHGSNGVGLGLWWCRSPTRPQNRTQGRTGPS